MSFLDHNRIPLREPCSISSARQSIRLCTLSLGAQGGCEAYNVGYSSAHSLGGDLNCKIKPYPQDKHIVIVPSRLVESCHKSFYGWVGGSGAAQCVL